MSSQSAETSPRTTDTSAQDTTPLLASENHDSVNRDGADADPEQTEAASSPSPGTESRSLSRHDRFIRGFLIAVLPTGVIQLMLTPIVYYVIALTDFFYDFYNMALLRLNTFTCFSVTALLGIIVTVIDLILLRRKGYPGHTGLNVFVFFVIGVLLVCTDTTVLIVEAWRVDREVCDDYDVERCLQHVRLHMVLMLIYLVVGLILSLEYLALLATFLLKAYGRGSSPHRSLSTSPRAS